MNKTLKIVLLLAVTAVLGAAAFAGIRHYMDNVVSNFEHKYVLYIDEGMTLDSVIDSIEANASVKRGGSLRRMAVAEGLDTIMTQGRYLIQPGMSSAYVARMIRNNWQTPARVTVAGYIRDRGKLSKVLSRSLQMDSADVSVLLADEQYLDSLGFPGQQVLGMVLPDTYEVYWTVTPEQLLERFRKEYDRFWDSLRLAKADSIGLTPKQVSVLASIIMEESNAIEEYPDIAGVYLNRLRKGMKLQADPTARFAYGDFTVTRVLYRHTEIDSPYNTYKYYGLPPAPINVPSKQAIDGVLNARDHNYLFFCARPEFDGRHNFAVTYAEHRRNAKAYQRAYTEWKRRKDQEKAS